MSTKNCSYFQTPPENQCACPHIINAENLELQFENCFILQSKFLIKCDSLMYPGCIELSFVQALFLQGMYKLSLIYLELLNLCL